MSFFRIISLSLLSSAAVLTTGCGMGLPDTTPQQGSLGSLQGSVHGGQQAVVGAKVYVYATGTTAYAGPGIAASASNASTSLLTSAVLTNNPGNSGIDGSGNYYVTTNATGMFLVTGDYTCTLGTDVYLYVTGGNPGAGTNIAAGLLAALGPCPATGGSLASAVPFVTVNEVTTIAAAYAFAGFASDATHVSNSGSALGIQGLANAFASSNELVNLSNGAAYASTPAGNGTVPQTLINTLANILASCVNTNGSMNSSPATNCYTLFTDTATGATLDTATAAINVAHAPGVNVSSLFALQAASGAPFIPNLSAAPNDFTIGVNFTGGGLNQPYGIAVDALGNVWIANSEGGVSKFNGGSGAAISPATGYTGGGFYPYHAAIDLSGNVWTINFSSNPYQDFLSELNGNTGAAISPSGGYTGGGLESVQGIAIDGFGNIWVADEDNSISKFNGSTGAAMSPSTGYTGGGLNNLSGIAIDASGNVWATSGTIGLGIVSEFNGSTGAPISPSSGYTGGGLNHPQAVAIDHSGNVWVANEANCVSEFNGSTGAAISPSTGYTGGGVFEPLGIAIDGSGNVWTADGYNEVSEFNSAGVAISPSAGYTGGNMYGPSGIAIDGSGNVWINGAGPSVNGYGGNGALTKLIGAATPVVTPLAAGVKNNTLGTRP